MRRLSAVTMLLLATAAPAGAHTGANATRVMFSGAIPCAVVCAYWVNNGFEPCENPFPPGAYVDVLTAPAPTPPEGKVAIIEATLDMVVDWDSFLCESEPPYREIAQGANILGEPCGGHGPTEWLFPPGCHEDMSALLRAGQTTIFRAYNFLDAPPATGRYWFVIV